MSTVTLKVLDTSTQQLLDLLTSRKNVNGTEYAIPFVNTNIPVSYNFQSGTTNDTPVTITSTTQPLVISITNLTTTINPPDLLYSLDGGMTFGILKPLQTRSYAAARTDVIIKSATIENVIYQVEFGLQQ